MTLRESDQAIRNRHAEVLACLPGLVLTFRPDKNLDYSSPQWTEFTGLTEQEQRGVGWLAAVHPDDRLSMTRAWDDVMSHGEERVLDCRMRKRDYGSYRRFLVRAAPNRDPSGSIVGLCAVYVEIDPWRKSAAGEGLRQHAEKEQRPLEYSTAHLDASDRTEIEEHIGHLNRQLEQRNAECDAERMHWRGVVEAIADEVWVCDAQGKMSLINLPDVTAMGLPAFKDKTVEEVLSEVEIIDPDGLVRPPEQAPLLRSLKGEVVRGEEIMRHIATGRTRHRQFSSAPRRDASGAITGAVAIVRDVTESKRLEQALREGENKYRSLYENQLDGFAYCRMLYDEDNRPCDFVYLDVNESFVKSTGLCDVVGKRATEAFPGIREAKPDLMELYGRVASAGKPERVEVFFKPRSWFHVSAYSPKKDHFVSVVENVTKRKAAEAERERLVEALREADCRKNEFLAMLSHELRNPLAPIRSSLYILDRSTPDGEQAHRARAIIERQVSHLTRLVNDLLDVSRITRGRIELQRERLDLCELVSRTLEDHRPIFAARGIEVRSDLPDAPVWMNGDAIRLEQALSNILQNAAKFTPQGGRVFVQIRKEGQEAVVVVRDTGAGIAPDVLADLFQPFMQADRSLDRSAGGLGLGLSLVRGLVDLHGGNIHASSGGPGQGAAFTIRLPVEGEPVCAGQREMEAASSRSQRRVLVIEDNVDSAVSLKDALELNRHEVTVAFTGAEGLASARAFVPDVVLCDIGLSGMNGYDVARAFRADDMLHNIALVALTGYASADDRRRAEEAGFDWHLAKPPELDAIERILEELPQSRC